MSPNVVCQLSFFTLAVAASTAPLLLLGRMNLAFGPGLQQRLPQPTNLLRQP
jgi:hypothetical protein